MAQNSSKSFADLDRRALWILAAAAALGALVYLAASALTLRVGFPLDDSWIHLTYARNLAERGEWAFLPGQPSAGSTAPLWSALLAFGFWLRLAPYVWAYLLGALLLWTLAVTAELAVRRAVPTYRPRPPWAGLLFAFEWHLVWASVSGMETLLHALVVTLVLVLLTTNPPRPLTLGLLAGLSVWVRPDGLTLLGPVLVTLLVREKRISSLTRFFIGFGLLFGLYLLFNLMLSGNPFPNTFYAKQAEYAAWQARPIMERLGLHLLQILTGPSIMLLPGVIVWLVKSVRERDWATLAGMVWFTGYLLIYAYRLPPYQHGRYLVPAMPVFFLWGAMAVAHFSAPGNLTRWLGPVRVAWVSGIALLALLFWGLGARSYAQDVALIESEMVTVARWVDANLPPEALVAAHDIGALGYFDHHRLIDLAGLVSPQVIPFLRDDEKLAEYLTAQRVDYFIAFPELYPGLAAQAEVVFRSGGLGPRMGGENLVVYRWALPQK
ncbi:MAG: hypothetical protein ACOYZ8_10910 [Chloroflexota bacterium]